MAIDDALDEVADNLAYAPATVVREAMDASSHFYDPKTRKLERLLDDSADNILNRDQARTMLDIADLFAAGYLSDIDGKNISRVPIAKIEEPKKGFFQKLRDEHPTLYKALVLGATIATVGLAAGCLSSQTHKEPGKDPITTKLPVSVPDIENWYPGSVVYTPDNLTDSTVQVFSLDGKLLQTYTLDKNSNSQVGSALGWKTYESHSHSTGGPRLDFEHEQYIIKCNLKAPDRKDTVVEFKTGLSDFIGSQTIKLGGANGILYPTVIVDFGSDGQEDINLTYDYSITKNGAVVASEKSVPNDLDDNDIEFEVSGLNDKSEYVLEIDVHADGISRAGEVGSSNGSVKIPFVLSSLYVG